MKLVVSLKMMEIKPIFLSIFVKKIKNKCTKSVKIPRKILLFCQKKIRIRNFLQKFLIDNYRFLRQV